MDKDLINNVWGKYAPQKNYGKTFNNQLKKIEVIICAELLKLYFIDNNLIYEARSSMEREITRDLILKLFKYPAIRTHPIHFLDFDLEYDHMVNQIIIWCENQVMS
jgi:hypothetical protein